MEKMNADYVADGNERWTSDRMPMVIQLAQALHYANPRKSKNHKIVGVNYNWTKAFDVTLSNKCCNTIQEDAVRDEDNN